MKRLMHVVSAVFLTGVLVLAPVDLPTDCPLSITVQAHGRHHGNGHHNNAASNYFYCNGHEAHQHNNGA